MDLSAGARLKVFFYKDAPLDEIIEEREARVQSMQAFLTEIL